MSGCGKENYEVFVVLAVCSAVGASQPKISKGGTRVQEEATQKTIAFAVKTTKLTAFVR